MSYLEMKYNLMMSYCTFLAFYLLLKVEGKNVDGHPVVYRLTHIKTLLEKLRPLDQKLSYQIEKMLKEANANAALPGKKDALSYKPNLKDMASGSENDDDFDDEEEGEASMEEESLSKASEISEVSEDDAVYRAPKIRAVQFDEDAKADKKARQHDAYERKRMGKSELI